MSQFRMLLLPAVSVMSDYKAAFNLLVEADRTILAKVITEMIDLMKRAPISSVASSPNKLVARPGCLVRKRIVMLRGYPLFTSGVGLSCCVISWRCACSCRRNIWR